MLLLFPASTHPPRQRRTVLAAYLFDLSPHFCMLSESLSAPFSEPESSYWHMDLTVKCICGYV